MSAAARGVVIDVTRAVSRAGLGPPTGIDRVERAWIDAALDGRFGVAAFLARAGGARVIGPATMRVILGVSAPPPPDLRARLSRTGGIAARIGAEIRRREERFPAGATYFNLGHANLSVSELAEVRALGASRVAVMIHDIIPLEHPQFARAGGAAKMRARLAAAETADAVIYNSADTRLRAEARMRTIPVGLIAPLGVDAAAVQAPAHGGFVVLGSIEPRKSHALLLDIWAGLGVAPPPLHIVGRRGWLNEAVFARLDAGQPGVIEAGALDDGAARALLSGARALLFPSFAEGYGLPLAEALAMGVPVIAADLPALREVGGAAPFWLSPRDAAGWRAAILDFARPDSSTRLACLEAMKTWRAPTWDAHFAVTSCAIEGFPPPPGGAMG